MAVCKWYFSVCCMATSWVELLWAHSHCHLAEVQGTLRNTCTRAGVYYEQGKLEQAIATYREALLLEPNFPEAYNNLGNALREAGRPDEAIQCYTACIQLQLGRPPSGEGKPAP